MKTNEIVKGVLALIVVGGAVASVFIDQVASEYLLPVATFVLGFYFKGSGIDLAVRGVFTKKK